MRDILDEIFDAPQLDPIEAARRAMRPRLRKRFYQRATVRAEAGQYAVVLDGKPVKTPARRALASPARALADLLADEWNAQTEMINPASMPLARLANAVIDAVSDACAPVAEEVVKYLSSDLLFYRADSPAGLAEQQAAHWDPVLEWAADAFGARFVLAQGVVFAKQPADALEITRAVIPCDASDARQLWRLGALSSATALTGSALLALALMQGRLTAEEVWAAAHVDEDWQMAAWGRDEGTLSRRAARYEELRAAAAVLAQLKS